MNHANAVAIGVFREKGDDGVELRRHHVPPLRHILSDKDLLQHLNLGLDADLHLLQMRAEFFARPRPAFRLVVAASLGLFGFSRRRAGGDLVKRSFG